MNTDTVRLNITLPKELVQDLDKLLASPRKRSQFISKSVEQYIKMVETEKIEKLLEEGYRATREEDLDLAKEFENIDLEGWDEY